MDHLLFAAYLILFAWLVTRVRFFARSGLTPAQLVIFFLLKVMAGIFYGWIGVYYGQTAQMVDTWAYYYEGLGEQKLLLSDPGEFVASLFRNSYEGGYTNFLVSKNSWWNDLKANFFIKVLGIFNVLSFGNYYTNVVFYSFLTMFGPVAMFRIMKDVFPEKRIPVLLATFLIPSFIYWTSGLHKDGLIFAGFALTCYHLYFGFRQNSFPWYRILGIFLGVLMVLMFRNFLMLALLPALGGWILAEKTRTRPVLAFLSVYLVCTILFFTAQYIDPKLDFPQAVVTKQKEFLALGGGSAVQVSLIEPSFVSFLTHFPQAFQLSVLRPLPSDVRHLLSLAASVEILLLFLVFLAFLTWRGNGIRVNPFLLFCIFFSFSVLMMVGYSVNILGAVVRYRSIVLPFLVIPMVALINWKRVNELLFGNM